MNARRRTVVEVCPHCRAPLNGSHTWVRCLEDRRLVLNVAKLRRNEAARVARHAGRP